MVRRFVGTFLYTARNPISATGIPPFQEMGGGTGGMGGDPHRNRRESWLESQCSRRLDWGVHMALDVMLDFERLRATLDMLTASITELDEVGSITAGHWRSGRTR